MSVVRFRQVASNLPGLDKIKTGEDLLGNKDGSNTDFNSPETFELMIGTDGFFFEFFRNGQLQDLGTQYVIVTLAGVGTGLRIFNPPRVQESLKINFISAE